MSLLLLLQQLLCCAHFFVLVWSWFCSPVIQTSLCFAVVLNRNTNTIYSLIQHVWWADMFIWTVRKGWNRVCSRELSCTCEIGFSARFRSSWLSFRRSAEVSYDFLQLRNVNTSLVRLNWLALIQMSVVNDKWTVNVWRYFKRCDIFSICQ